MLRAMEENLQIGNPEDGAPQQDHAVRRSNLFLITLMCLTGTIDLLKWTLWWLSWWLSWLSGVCK
jgi:hypothetical protein